MTAQVEDSGDIAGMLADWDEATYTPKGHSHPSSKTRTIQGIFSNEYIEDSGAMSSQPNFRCAHADVSDVSSGAKLTTPNDLGVDTEYKIQGYEPGGSGLIHLILEEV